MRKYKLTDETIQISRNSKEVILHRIEALQDFADVKAGDKGGYVESEANLRHNGDCWIFGNAKVYGDALVCGDACVRYNAEVYDNAEVYGDACVKYNAEVYGNAEVYDYTKVCGGAAPSGKSTNKQHEK